MVIWVEWGAPTPAGTSMFTMLKKCYKITKRFVMARITHFGDARDPEANVQQK